jgi:DNA-binding beta-propeller fold protein YncE
MTSNRTRTMALLLSGALATFACGETEESPLLPEQVALPGDTYYPESLTAAADGTLYVGSLATGQVVMFKPGVTEPEPFLAGGDPKGVAGVLADSDSSTLYLCAVDLTTMPPTTEVRAYDLETKKLRRKYPFGAPAFCNDLALDTAGNLYVADSFGKIHKLPRGGTALAVWSSDPLLAPSSPSGYGADGIAVDGQTAVFVNTFTDSRLLRIPINADGSAGTPGVISVQPPLQGPDGMRLLDAKTLVVVEGFSGRLTKIVLSGATGTATALATGLNGPTSVAVTGSHYWVSEGQLTHFLGGTQPSVPFLVKRVTPQ